MGPGRSWKVSAARLGLVAVSAVGDQPVLQSCLGGSRRPIWSVTDRSTYSPTFSGPPPRLRRAIAMPSPPTSSVPVVSPSDSSSPLVAALSISATNAFARRSASHAVTAAGTLKVETPPSARASRSLPRSMLPLGYDQVVVTPLPLDERVVHANGHALAGRRGIEGVEPFAHDPTRRLERSDIRVHVVGSCRPLTVRGPAGRSSGRPAGPVRPPCRSRCAPGLGSR